MKNTREWARRKTSNFKPQTSEKLQISNANPAQCLRFVLIVGRRFRPKPELVLNAGRTKRQGGRKRRSPMGWTCRRRISITKSLSRGNSAAKNLCRAAFTGFGG